MSRVYFIYCLHLYKVFFSYIIAIYYLFCYISLQKKRKNFCSVFNKPYNLRSKKFFSISNNNGLYFHSQQNTKQIFAKVLFSCSYFKILPLFKIIYNLILLINYNNCWLVIVHFLWIIKSISNNNNFVTRLNFPCRCPI